MMESIRQKIKEIERLREQLREQQARNDALMQKIEAEVRRQEVE